jgi:lysozyme
MNMTISQNGLDLISSFEGLRLTAYRDAVGVLTIGFGHTGADVHPGLTITQQRAYELLREDSSGATHAVNELVTRQLDQPQFDALVSLTFNAGTAPLHGTLGHKLNSGDFEGALEEFGKWVKGTVRGELVTLAGLVRRRAAEAAMFKSGMHRDVTNLLNKNERDWVTRYDALVEAGKGGSAQAKQLQEKMRRQRKTIWKLAQPAAKGGDGNGWHFRNRLERYRALLARTT